MPTEKASILVRLPADLKRATFNAAHDARVGMSEFIRRILTQATKKRG